MRHLLLATLFLSFISVAQERPTGVDEASSHLNESDNAILLKSNKLAAPTTGGAQHQQTDPNFLEERVVVSINSSLSNEDSGGFSCPDGTDAACLDIGDKVCPGSARCVDLQDELPLGFDIVTLIYTDYSVLSPSQRASLLGRIRKMLNPGGRVVLDVAGMGSLANKQECTFIEDNLMNGFWADGDFIGVIATRL